MVTAALFECYDCMFESHLQILYVKVLTPNIMVFGGNWVISCHPFPPMRIRGEVVVCKPEEDLPQNPTMLPL